MNTVKNMQVENFQLANQQSKAMKITLWTVQILLALVFLFAGTIKLITPTDVLLKQMNLPLPAWFILFIGVAECAGALGLLLPGLLRIQRRLTPFAACGLLIIMIGATVITLATGGGAAALFPLIIGLLAALVIYGRRSYLAR